MRIKVQGGTSKHNEHLCRSCINATVAENERGSETIRCTQFRTLITSKIVNCSAYQNRNTPELYEMKQIAWVITEGRTKLGFVKYGDLPRKEQEKVDGEVGE